MDRNSTRATVATVIRKVRSRAGSDETRGHDGAADIYRSQEGPKILRTHQGSRRDAEPDRGSEGVLRPVPDGRGAAGRAGGRGPSGRVPFSVPDLGLLGYLDAGIRALRIRAAEI